MNEQQSESKLEKDGAKIKNAFAALVEDGSSKIKSDVTHFTDSVKDNANEAVSVVKKNVGVGLTHYNAKAQAAVDRLGGGISQNVIKFPWVVISLGLVFGIILGFLLKPSRQSN